jgi:hypothetical protein
VSRILGVIQDIIISIAVNIASMSVNNTRDTHLATGDIEDDSNTNNNDNSSNISVVVSDEHMRAAAVILFTCGGHSEALEICESIDAIHRYRWCRSLSPLLQHNFNKQSLIYLTKCLEYMCVDMLELSYMESNRMNLTTIEYLHLINAVYRDKLFSSVCKTYNIVLKYPKELSLNQSARAIHRRMCIMPKTVLSEASKNEQFNEALSHYVENKLVQHIFSRYI